MTLRKFKYIYGPVPSWRLGASLGIDPVSKGRKVCSFDCVYCQLGKTGLFTAERKKFIETEDIMKELATLPAVKIDYITFSGAGEPTLAENLGEMIKAVRQARSEKIAVITNSSLLPDAGVRESLLLADFVMAKLDAPNQVIFEKINQPLPAVRFDLVLDGIKTFRKMYDKKLALQVMFIEHNKDSAKEIARIAKEIGPDEVQINTPLRPCRVKPLPEREINKIESCFSGLKTISVYKEQVTETRSISDEDTLKRRGKVIS